jgi:hypothetical protein
MLEAINRRFFILLGLTQAPLKKGGWGDLECLEYYIFRYRCVSPIYIYT